MDLPTTAMQNTYYNIIHTPIATVVSAADCRERIHRAKLSKKHLQTN